MSKLTLSFFGEEVFLKFPETLSDLQEQISKLFLLNKEDTKELILTYKEGNEKITKINSNEDYKNFLDKKKNKINIDISQDSKIYKKELKEQEEKEENKIKLEKLIHLDEELEKPNNFEKEKIKEINGLINKFGYGANVLIKNIHSINNEKNIRQQKIREEICKLQKKMGMPEKYEKVGHMRLKAKPKPKKDMEEKKVDDKIKAHNNYICDGCNSEPIVGIRYKCAVCEDFDYCEKCEKELGAKHGHPFLKIRNPKDSPVYFNCTLKKNEK